MRTSFPMFLALAVVSAMLTSSPASAQLAGSGLFNKCSSQEGDNFFVQKLDVASTARVNASAVSCSPKTVLLPTHLCAMIIPTAPHDGGKNGIWNVKYTEDGGRSDDFTTETCNTGEIGLLSKNCDAAKKPTTVTFSPSDTRQIPDTDVTLDVYLVTDYDEFGYVQSGRIRCRVRADGGCRCDEIAEDKADA